MPFKVNISDKGKSTQLELESEAIVGKKIGDTIKGEDISSDLEGYELAGILASKKTPAYAKAGQIAPGEIEVKAGPTDLVPGPAISELGAFGIQIAVEDGKISIKADRVIASEGDNISGELASLLQKLNIQPFTVGLEPKAVFDVTEEKIYTELKIDPEGYTEELKQASGKALGFARKIVYYCKDTIGYFLAKANSEGEKLNSFSGSEEKEEDKVEKGSEEEKKDDSPAEEVKEEKKEEPAEEVKKEPKEDAQLNNPEESA